MMDVLQLDGVLTASSKGQQQVASTRYSCLQSEAIVFASFRSNQHVSI
jgi:hypothetical protein